MFEGKETGGGNCGIEATAREAPEKERRERQGRARKLAGDVKSCTLAASARIGGRDRPALRGPVACLLLVFCSRGQLSLLITLERSFSGK
jgi:hypothetical protein